MSLHTDLPIYRTGVQLLALAVRVQQQMPRAVKRSIQRTLQQPEAEVFASVNSTFGLFRQASHSHADRARLANAARRRGHSVNGQLTKAFA